MSRVNCIYCNETGRVIENSCYINCQYCSGLGYVDTIDVQGTVAKMCLALQKKEETENDHKRDFV